GGYAQAEPVRVDFLPHLLALFLLAALAGRRRGISLLGWFFRDLYGSGLLIDNAFFLGFGDRCFDSFGGVRFALVDSLESLGLLVDNLIFRGRSFSLRCRSAASPQATACGGRILPASRSSAGGYTSPAAGRHLGLLPGPHSHQVLAGQPGHDDRHVARALPDPRSPAPGPRPPPLHRGAFVRVAGRHVQLL